jgi:putative addiction module component (TIGR02574 family)
MTARTERPRIDCPGSTATLPSVRTTEIPNFDRLSDQERVALADEILGSLRNPGALPPPLAHRAELERRWAAYEANPGIALSREQFRAQVAALKK